MEASQLSLQQHASGPDRPQDASELQLVVSQASHLTPPSPGNVAESLPSASPASIMAADAQPDPPTAPPPTREASGAALDTVARLGPGKAVGSPAAPTLAGLPILASSSLDKAGGHGGAWGRRSRASFGVLPNELLLQILSYLDVSDLLSTSRASHHLRDLALAPVLHMLRLRRARLVLPPLLGSPSRPSLSDLIARSIFLTRTTVVSRKLARSLVCIRLSRRLAARPSPEVLVQRCVLPPECAPGFGHVAPGLVAKTRAIERERVKDRLRRWVGAVWKGEVRERSEGVKRWEERVGVGRVWRLRRFWERVSRGED